jgi:macrolide-specific efflux system membrane fusion protein
MKKTIKWIVILALLGGGGYWFYTHKIKKTADTKPTFDRAKAEIRDLRTTVESTGEIKPRNRLDVKPPIAGRLEELLIDEGDDVDKGQILGWVSSTERATLLDAALATSVKEYEYWQDLYKPSPLISPLKGTIIARNFEPGQSINANDAVVVIADDLIVIANLDETDIGQVDLGQKVEVRLEAYPDRAFDCEVEKIAYDARLVSNVTMYEVDVRPERLPSFARSGMTANLEFVIEEKQGALAIPASAILQKSGGSKSSPSAKGEGGGQVGGSDADRRKMVMERMRERGMSDAEIKERIAQFAQGGGPPRGGKKGGGKKGGGASISYVLVDSENPEKPDQRIVKTGVSDGSYTEVTEGLEKGDEVLIQKLNMGSERTGGSNPLMPTRMGRGGGRR